MRLGIKQVLSFLPPPPPLRILKTQWLDIPLRNNDGIKCQRDCLHVRYLYWKHLNQFSNGRMTKVVWWLLLWQSNKHFCHLPEPLFVTTSQAAFNFTLDYILASHKTCHISEDFIFNYYFHGDMMNLLGDKLIRVN